MTPVDKNSEPLDAILRRAMRSQPGPATPECADAESLAAYSDRSLSARERERLETHFADCARCQILLADIARADESARLAKSAGEVPWYRRWRVAIPALAAAAAVLVFISIRRPANVAPPNDRIVAMAQHEAPAEKLFPPPAAIPAAAPSAPVSEAAGAPSNEIAMNEPKPEAAPRAQAMRPGAPRALKGSVETFGAGALMARGAPAAKVEPQSPATTTPESVAAQAASADSVSRQALVNVAPPPTTARSAMAPAVGGMLAEPAAATNTRAFGGTGSGAIVAATGGVGSVGAGAGAVAGAAVAASPSDASASATLVTISAPDQSVSWIAGKNGMILRRDADGTHPQHSGASTDLVAGAAPSATVCWIVGRSGTIVRTTDGGEHWTLILAPTADNLAAVTASDANDATITTAGGRSFATSDGGTSWHPQ